jgi:diguanylate cyclase (GGDEF)-like protein/PAS domain S-box-containing protein
LSTFLKAREAMATTTEPLRVLLVEDDEDDYLITRDMLAAQDRAQYKLDWCSDYDGALAAIREQRHDVYLVDYRLGRHNGLDLVRAGFTSQPTVPVIVLTGQSDYEIDLEATALGVTDFLVKQELNPTSLERSLRYAVAHQRALSELACSEERYALAVRAASDGIWDWDLRRDRIYFSPRWHAILGQTGRDNDEQPAGWFDLVHHDDLGTLRAAIAAHISDATPHLQIELRMRHAAGGWRWVLVRGLAIRNPAGEATRLAGSLSDITERRAAERQLQHDALHDALTGLPNRALFMDRVDQALRRAVRDSNVGCAALFVDIDSFKRVNDSLSHSVGDRLLIALASRLAGVLRPADTVARLAGDEFTVLLDEVLDPATATTVAERVHQEIASVFTIDGHELVVTASIGISLSSPDISATELLRNADIAMYDSKRRGVSHSTVFDKGMHRRIVDRRERENDLRHAIDESLLGVYYQPIVDLTSGRIRALEALARWPPEWPQVAPVDFIPIAEDTGLIGTLGLHVLRTALNTLAHWRRVGLVAEDVRMSVNVSGHQLDDPGLPGNVRDAIATAGLKADLLLLEITESTLMQDPERTQAMVSKVCETGVGLHLDDYGTGYSSLSALHHYPVDALKIDRSFVASMNEESSGSDVIVRSTVALAHNLGLRVIAEGIEDASQLQRLRTFGCEFGQGYLFSKALSREDTETLLTDWPHTWAAAARHPPGVGVERVKNSGAELSRG